MNNNPNGGDDRNINKPLQMSQMQPNYNSVSNQQTLNFSSFSPETATSGLSISQSQQQGTSEFQDQNIFRSRSQNQEPPKVHKKRGRKPKPKPDDPNFTPNNNSSLSSIMSTRTRSRSAQISQSQPAQNENNGGNGSDEDDESDFDQENENDKGIPLDAVLCKTQFPFQPNKKISTSTSQQQNSGNISRSPSNQNFDPNEPQYLVKMPQQAPIHSFIICEHSIKSGSQSGKLLNDFKKSCEYSQIKISSAGLEFIEPCSMEKIVSIDSFEINQIIAHRTFESETKFMEKLMDPNVHIPGLPTETFPPGFEDLFKYSNTFFKNPYEASAPLHEDGFFYIGEDQQKCNRILTKELFHEVEPESENSEDENSNENDKSRQGEKNDEDDDLRIPEKIEFKIQWKNLPASQSTWESFESLVNLISLNEEFDQENGRMTMNSDNNIYNKYLNNGTVIKENLFCPTNMDELDGIIQTYWSRVINYKNLLSSKDESIPIEEVPEEIPPMGRQTILTDFQQSIIRQLFECKIHFLYNRSYDNTSNGLCQIIPMKNTGRVFAVVGYLQMLYSIYRINKPSMIVVHDQYADVWKSALKCISSLYWVEFAGSSSDRMMIKHHRLNKKTRFDILILNSHVLEKESNFLKSYQWETIIIDDVHSKNEFVFNQQLLPDSNEYVSNISIRKRRGRKKKNLNSNSIIGFSQNNDYSSSSDDADGATNNDVNEEENVSQNQFNEPENKEEVESKSDDVLFDPSLIGLSHSLSVLASTILKNKNRYRSFNGKKNSPFVILMNDTFPFSPLFNQMEQRAEIVPFHFTEEIFLVPNLLSHYTYKKLSILFKKRAARILNMNKSVDILHEIVLSLQHPFILPNIHKELFKDFTSSRGINQQKISASIELEFLRSICGKLKTLDELTVGTPEKSLMISVIVAEDLAILKLLRIYFVMRRIPAGIVNTNVAMERVPDDFAYGILLMNRDINHKMLDRFTISQIIFYDVSSSYKKDLDFIQFIFRNQTQGFNVFRLLTRHSIESELFIKTTMLPEPANSSQVFSSFDYKELTARNVEPLIRATVLSEKEAEAEREEANSTVPQFQFQYQQPKTNKANETVSSFAYEYPATNDKLPSLLNSVMNQIERDEFWQFAFQVGETSKAELTDFSSYFYNFEDEENENVDEKDASDILPEFRLYVELLKHGIGNWEKIAEKIGKSIEEVQKIGRAMILKMLSNIPPNKIFEFTLVSNIYWFEYSETFATGHQLDEPEFWMRIAESKMNQVNSPLFKNPCFLVNPNSNMNSRSVFDGSISERNLKYFEENYIVRAYLSIRSEPYIPTRLFAKKGICIYSPRFIYSFLNYFSSNTGDWEAIKTKFKMNLYSTDSIINYFNELYNAIVSDLFSFILHAIYSGERQHLIDQNRILWPLFQIFEQGPFTLNWCEAEVDAVTAALSNYRIPLASQSVEDWCEFHSLTRLFSKSTESIEFLTSYLVEGLAGAQDGQKFVIIPDITCGDPITITPSVVKKLKLKMFTMQYIQQLSREESLNVFSPQVSMPDGWTVEDDHNLIKGIVQFGYGKIFDLCNVDAELFSESENARFCPIMNESLSKFSSFFGEKSSLLMRLKLILTSNAKMSDGSESFINEQLNQQASKAASSHRRGRPPNPYKRKEAPRAQVDKPITVSESNQNIAASPDTESKEIETYSKPKKATHLTSKQKKIEEETGFVPEKIEEVDDNDDDEFESYDSEESDFNSRLRAMPMTTRARTSLDKGGMMLTRNRTKRLAGRERREAKKKEEVEKRNFDENEIIIQNDDVFEENPPEPPKPKKVSEPKPKNLQPPKPKKAQLPKPAIKKEKAVKKETNFDVEDFVENEIADDDDDFNETEEEDSGPENQFDHSHSLPMQTRSKTSPKIKRVINMKTRSQFSKKTQSENESKKQKDEKEPEKVKKAKKVVKPKRMRKIAFIYDPAPETIKFTLDY